jgi:DNA-binding IclR family transcriptional regulator
LKTANRVLAVLRLFSIERPDWTVEAAAQELGLSQSTAYEYFKSLVDSGLVVASKPGRYVIGPAIIEYDRLTRSCDPLIANAQPILKELVRSSPIPAVGLLCRLYRLTVMCVDQYTNTTIDFAVSYERGRPMPLFRGAASKVILAHMERRKLRRYFDEFAAEVAEAGMGESWRPFRAALRRIRTAETIVTKGELDAGRVGVSAPVFGPGDEVLGSIGLVLSESDLTEHEGLLAQLELKVRLAGRELSAVLKENDEPARANIAAAVAPRTLA